MDSTAEIPAWLNARVIDRFRASGSRAVWAAGDCYFGAAFLSVGDLWAQRQKKPTAIGIFRSWKQAMDWLVTDAGTFVYYQDEG